MCKYIYKMGGRSYGKSYALSQQLKEEGGRMKYKEFRKWCEARATDGCWGMQEATSCIMALTEIDKYSIFKREKIWQENYAEYITPLVDYINLKIEELGRQNNAYKR